MDTNPTHWNHGDPFNISITEMLGKRFTAEAQFRGISEKEVAVLAIQRGISMLESLGEHPLE